MTNAPRLAALLLSCPGLFAQWSTNPSTNLPIGDRANSQDLGIVAPTKDGGCYIGWFDPGTGPYQVWLQRLDAAGVEQWPHGGVLVSSNPQNSSLIGWDLITDSEDDCVLTFTDVRSGPDLDVYAYRVSPAGAMLWGANGITLSANSDAEANPRVCQTSDGDFVFVWSRSTTNTIQYQRVDKLGAIKYPADGIAVVADAGVTPGFCRVAAGDAGSFIVSWVRNFAVTGSNKHVHTQKYDALGAPLWNGGVRVPVFDGGSMPTAYEPQIYPDGSGGALYAFHYPVGSQYFSRVQRLNATGGEVFAHNGVDVSTNANTSKFNPVACWNAAAQEIVVFWNERNIGQSMWGITAQKVGPTGSLLWGTNGVTLLPINTVVKYAPVGIPFAGGGICAVLEESLGGLADKVLALRVDAAGSVVWATPVEACNAVSDKLRLAAAGSPSGVLMLSWTDKRADGGDVYVQNVNPNGTLGAKLASDAPSGCNGINPANSFRVTGRAALGTGVKLGVQNPLGTQPNGSTLFLVGAAGYPGWPCGLGVPGFGMASSVALGELLVDVGQPVLLLAGPPWAGIGNWAEITLQVPLSVGLVGQPLYVQGAVFSARVALANGARLVVGF